MSDSHWFENQIGLFAPEEMAVKKEGAAMVVETMRKRAIFVLLEILARACGGTGLIAGT